MYNVAVLVGSLRKASINKVYAENIVEGSKDLFNAYIIPLDDVPMYNQDLEENLPEPVVRMKKALQEADGVIFVTPEYNRSIPPVLKNAIDWASRPYGTSIWPGKPGVFCGVSASAAGTAVAQSHLRMLLPMVGMRILGQPEMYITALEGFFDQAGFITEERDRQYLRRFVESFKGWIDLNKKG